MDAEKLWTGLSAEERQRKGAFEAMLEHRRRFEAAVATFRKKPSRKKLRELWQEAAAN